MTDILASPDRAHYNGASMFDPDAKVQQLRVGGASGCADVFEPTEEFKYSGKALNILARLVDERTEQIREAAKRSPWLKVGGNGEISRKLGLDHEFSTKFRRLTPK